MFPDLSPTRSAVVFYLLAIGMVTAVAVGGGSTAAAMMTPLVAVLLMLIVVTREGWSRRGWTSLGLHRLGLRTWPVAVALPLAINGAAGITMVASGAAHWEPEGNPALVTPVLWPAVILLNIVVASATVSLTEEVGWRGYLVPRLASLGERRAMLLSGVMHGVWHLPVILLTGLYLADGDRAVVLPMFLLCVAAVGVFMGWLRLRTGSVWPAVLAHSAHNIGVMWVADALAGSPARMEFIGGESGIITVAGYLALAAVLLTAAAPKLPTPVSGPGVTRGPAGRQRGSRVVAVAD